MTGSVTGIQPSAEPRFDGDIRGPFVLEMRTDDPRVTGPGYQWATLRARGGAAAAPAPSIVDAVLYDAEPALVEFGCDAKRFVVLGVTIADSAEYQ